MSRTIDIETFVLDILNVIEFEQLDNVVLVGHSFGARSVCGVADRIPSTIRRLVFLDGGLPFNGLSRLDSMDPAARDARIASSMQLDNGISVPPPDASKFGVLDPIVRSWANRLMTPQPLNAERTPLKLNFELGNGRPATFVRCTNPALGVVEPSAAYARSRQDWRYRELDAGHNAMITHPDLVAQTLLKESDV